jgi:molybdopterin-synthase adenylyltransferase
MAVDVNRHARHILLKELGGPGQARLSQARALMIVGFAGVIVGLLVGGDAGTLVAIAGAAVGLYGLYHYLK